ncbi:group III truncated hemoglobin [Gymnodinialimonas sp. 57CJ19]|uniref:group III truncated hemoglobin n=1 Tax=Gymnodinialimonas sp. 57CJ19 TaxID=3138498 RepID=UPI003134256B
MNTLARVDVTEAQIRLVLDRFYARVRENPDLAPIFHHTVGTDPQVWEAHIAKIARFWRNALLRDPVYDGNPMLAHAGVAAIQPEHFAIWLGIFDDVLTEVLPPDVAARWSLVAHRIGRGLSLGLRAARARQSDIPDLRL